MNSWAYILNSFFTSTPSVLSVKPPTVMQSVRGIYDVIICLDNELDVNNNEYFLFIVLRPSLLHQYFCTVFSRRCWIFYRTYSIQKQTYTTTRVIRLNEFWVKKTQVIGLNQSECIWMNLWKLIISLMNPFFELTESGRLLNKHFKCKLLLSFSSQIQLKIKIQIQDTNLQQIFVIKYFLLKLQHYYIKYNLIV